MADDALDRQYEIMRRRAAQTANTAADQEREGLRRRFAAIGSLNSGAAIKAESQVADRGAKRLEEANQNIDFQQAADAQRRKEIEEGRAFATSEREAGQKFASAMQELGFGQQTKEREAGQKFVSEQALSQRQYEAGENAKNRDFQNSLADKSAALQREALTEQGRQFDIQFAQDRQVNAINSVLAQVMAGIMSAAEGKVNIWSAYQGTGTYGNIAAGRTVPLATNSNIRIDDSGSSYNQFGLPN